MLHEGTVAITHAFAGKKTSMFIISSHIVEAGDELKQKKKYRFPLFTYADERHCSRIYIHVRRWDYR